MSSSKEIIIFIFHNKLINSNIFEIPEGIRYFNFGLNDYKNIDTLKILKSLSSIGLWILPSTIKNIEVDSLNENFISKNNCLYSKDEKNLYYCFEKGENVILSEKLENVLGHSFKTALNLTEINFPDSLKSIYNEALGFCYKLKKVYLGKNVFNLHPIFKYKNYSGEVFISKDNPYYMIEDGILYSKDKSKLICALKSVEGKFIVDNSVKIIRDAAFHNRHELSGIILPEGLQEIGGSFIFCNFKEIIIPKTVKKIGSNDFANNPNLLKIVSKNKKDSILGAPWGAMKGNRIIEWKP